MLFCLICSAPVTADVIELTNGDKLTVNILERTEQHIIVEHPILGQLTLPIEQIISPPELSPEKSTASDREASALQQSGLDDAPPLDPSAALAAWKYHLELGLDGTEGNSETSNFRGALMGDFENDDKRWHLGAAMNRSTTDRDATRNDFVAEAIRDWLIPQEKHFYFVDTRYDYDDFQAWRHRIAGAGGVGYQFANDDTFELIGRVGGGANYAWGGGSDSEVSPELLLGIEGKWKIKDGHSFEFKNTLYPDIGDTGQFRNLTSLAYIVTLDHAKGMSLKLGLDNEYQSQTDDDSKQNDLIYYAALVFDF